MVGNSFGLIVLCLFLMSFFGYASEDAAIQVIGAGLGRTGTMSLQVALKILGYNPYHMEEFVKDSSHPALWRNFAEGSATGEKLFGKIAREGYTATMDNPMCDVFAEQMRIFPNAKVVLTEHPKGSSGWVKSFSSLLCMIRVQSPPFSPFYPNFFSLLPMFKDINAVRCMMGTFTMGLQRCELMYNSHERPREWWEEQYEKHNANVKAKVPRDRLLVYDVSQGWAPLCDFLGKPIPDVPFPQSNDSASMRRLAVILEIVIYAWVPCFGFLILLICRCCRRKAKVT